MNISGLSMEFDRDGDYSNVRIHYPRMELKEMISTKTVNGKVVLTKKLTWLERITEEGENNIDNIKRQIAHRHMLEDHANFDHQDEYEDVFEYTRAMSFLRKEKELEQKQQEYVMKQERVEQERFEQERFGE